jgi:hypothetical protein
VCLRYRLKDGDATRATNHIAEAMGVSPGRVNELLVTAHRVLWNDSIKYRVHPSDQPT